MKNIFLFSAIFFSQLSFATVYTVSNNVSNPGQYTTIQAAVDVSSPGDTIYVHGSSTAYAGFDAYWNLTMIGSGYNNPNGANTTISSISNFYRANSTVGPNGTRVMGFEFSNVIVSPNFTGGDYSTQVADDIVFERNKFAALHFDQAGSTFSNITVKNNVFIGNTAIGIVNGVFNNINITNNYFEYANFYLINPISTTVYFRNNFCYGVSLIGTTGFFKGTNVDSLVVENNIFWEAEPNGCTTCIFNNNITYNNIDNNLETSTGNPSSLGTGNIIGQDPQFVNYPIIGAILDYSYDYNLNSGSSGLGTGTGGTNIGFYGGMYPFIDPGTNPYIPQMQYITLPLGGAVGVGTNLNVEFKSHKQD